MPEGIKIIGRAKQKESLAKTCSTYPKKPAATHTQIQKAFIQYVKKAHPNKARNFIKITNEGKKEVGKLKAEGMHTGAYDLFYAEPKYFPEDAKDIKAGLWIEVKRDKDKVSDEQWEFGALMRINGYDAVICFGLDMTIAVFDDYLKGKDLTKYFIRDSQR